MLREDLMCTSDVGLVGSGWFNLSGEVTSLPQFDTLHQCRDFDRIRSWARERQVRNPPEDVYFRQPSPEDIKQL